jgi:hypothetical protein
VSSPRQLPRPAGETSRLKHQEAGINREERGMRAQDNGQLTKTDCQTLHQQQNEESSRIYREKHNGTVRKDESLIQLQN